MSVCYSLTHLHIWFLSLFPLKFNFTLSRSNLVSVSLTLYVLVFNIPLLSSFRQVSSSYVSISSFESKLSNIFPQTYLLNCAHTYIYLIQRMYQPEQCTLTMYISFFSVFFLHLILVPAIQFYFDSSYAFSFISKDSQFPNEDNAFSTGNTNFLSCVFKWCVSTFLSSPENVSENFMMRAGP